jgi:UDP-N-acetylglucosamine 3-dehydrogenase
MIKIGLLGAGYIGTIHAGIYSKLPDVETIYIYDKNFERAEQLAYKVGGNAVASAEDIFENLSVELIDISLPTSFHPEFAVRSFGSGKHVICEKPLALSLKEVDKILDSQSRSGNYLFVGHVLRFSPVFQTVKKLLDDGVVGKSLFATTYRLSGSPQWATWFKDPAKSGGVVLDLMIHDLDLFNWFFGLPQSVFARGVCDELGSWNYVNALLIYENGFSAAIEASNMMPLDFPFLTGLKILCEQGAIELQTRINGGKIDDKISNQTAFLHLPHRPNQPLLISDEDPFEKELSYFIRCIREEHQPEIVTPKDARNAVKIGLSIRESLNQNVPIEIGGELSI